MSLMLFSELVLGKNLKNDYLRKVKRSSKLPDVLSVEEVKKVIGAVENIKHKAILSLIYSLSV